MTANAEGVCPANGALSPDSSAAQRNSPLTTMRLRPFSLFLLAAAAYGAPTFDADSTKDFLELKQEENLVVTSQTTAATLNVLRRCADLEDDNALSICVPEPVNLQDTTGALPGLLAVTATQTATPPPTRTPTQHEHGHGHGHDHQREQPPPNENGGNDNEQDSDSPERDFAGLPISDGRRRSSTIGVIAAMCVHSTLFISSALLTAKLILQSTICDSCLLPLHLRK